MAETVNDGDVQYAIDIVQMICDKVGPGLPGTPHEYARATLIKMELESHLGIGMVDVEEFESSTNAFLGSLPLSALFLLISALLNLFLKYVNAGTFWIFALISMVLAILAPLPFIYEYIKYYEFIDPLYKKQKSINVIGRIKKPGTKKVKRLLMLSGHHDSALENTWISLLGYGFFTTIPVLVFGFLIMIVKSLILLTGMIISDSITIQTGILGYVLLAFPVFPAILVGLFFNRGRKNGGTVPGAADNLAACAIVIAICRFLVRNPSMIPDDTEIRFVTFGCEEAGLRGSRRYVSRHLDELKHLDTRLLNYEVIAYPEISILTNDVNGVKNSEEMVISVKKAAERAGVPYKVTPYPLGGGASDAGSFSQAGLKAVTLFPCKFPQQIVAFYHQKQDTPKILSKEPILNVMKLTLEWIKNGGE